MVPPEFEIPSEMVASWMAVEPYPCLLTKPLGTSRPEGNGGKKSERERHQAEGTIAMN